MGKESLLLSALLLGGVTMPEVAIAQQQAAQTTELTYDDYMSLGYNAQQEGRFYEAAQYFRYALYVNPDDEAAIIAYWNAYGQIDGNSSAASFDQLMNRGYGATDAGSYATALDYFEQALALRPGDPYAAQAILNVETYLGGTTDAATDPFLAIDFADPSSIAAAYADESAYDRYMRLGYAALQQEAFIDAANNFRSALYERPNDRMATIAYWNAIDGSKDGEAGLGSETAESAYDRYMRLGYDANQRGDYPAALSFFQQALDLRPGDYYATEAISNVTTYMSE